MRSINLGDPHETPCVVPGACAPDIFLISAAYDQTGAVLVSVTFWDPLPAYDPSTAARVRVNLGHGLTSDGQDCAGDLRVEVGAYQSGSSGSIGTAGAVYLAGSQVAVPVATMISSDLKTLTVSASARELAGLQMTCAGGDLVNEAGIGSAPVVRDPVRFQWLTGLSPAPSIQSHSDTAGSTTATITALIGPGGDQPATAHVEFSTRIGVYGPQPESAPLTTTQELTFHLVGLKPGTQYHYRIVATSGTTTVYTPDLSFLTSGQAVASGPTLHRTRDSRRPQGRRAPHLQSRALEGCGVVHLSLAARRPPDREGDGPELSRSARRPRPLAPLQRHGASREP